jgi:hypothetical protein
MSTIWISRPRYSFAAAIATATLAALALGSIASASAMNAAHARAKIVTPKAFALDDEMRALWEVHGTWTERAIVDFAGGLPDVPFVVTRLLANQTDIGNAIKPYYGAKAGNALTALLKTHINDAVAVLKAAKSGDSKALATAKTAFYANGDQVARFLHAANPQHWSLAAMAAMMRTHLDQVVGLATAQLEGHYADAVGLYNVYIGHILDMADMLSNGIVAQFPARFR